MATDEPETDPVIATPWVERWTDITQVVPPKPIVVTEREPEPMVTPRGVVMVIITIVLTLTIIEVVFGGSSAIGRTRQRH
jgi:hypothetical protein